MKYAIMFLIFSNFNAYSAPSKNHACLKDIQKICPEAIGDKRLLMNCIQKHEKELSHECTKKTLKIKEAAKKRLYDLNKYCVQDAKKLCSDITPGKGAILKCLREKSNETSQNCRSLL